MKTINIAAARRIGLLVLAVLAVLVACGGGGGAATDTTPPTVTSTSPASAATAVAVNAAITATFSETMDAATITSASFTLDNGVTGAVTYSGTTATFTPSSNLAYSTAYTATITTAAKDTAGNALAANKVWSFTTGIVLDTTPPTVTSTNPASGAAGVAVNAAITATFSEAMDATTITSANFTLSNGVTGAVTYSGTTATFTPSSDLAHATAYTATITTGAKDTAGNALAANKVWSFTTAPLVASSTINDTGMTLCDDGANALVACTSLNSGDTSAMPRQDANFGRDAQAAASTLKKIGAGAAGFDYTRVCMSGELAGVGACAASPAAAANQSTPTANEWACTKDNVTNLVWSLETGNGDQLTYGKTTFPATTNAASRCGFASGWRLPTRRELLSVVHNGVINPAIDTGYFPGTVAGMHWSSDTYTPVPAGTSAWGVGFVSGLTYPDSKAVVKLVRLVHGAQLAPGVFADNGDGTVSDTVTGLMWAQCSQGQSGAACATGAATPMLWSAALSAAVAANTANYKGHNDWRLPNKSELESLVILSNSDPTLDLTAFPATPPSSVYWSSTSFTTNPIYAWDVSFLDGYTTASGIKTFHSFLVRLVRGGQ